MTDTQFMVILGAVWLAPHLGKTHGVLQGALLTSLGCLKIWGLI
jgi:hypothetical protein